MKTFIDFETKIVKLLTNEVSNVTITFKSAGNNIRLWRLYESSRKNVRSRA